MASKLKVDTVESVTANGDITLDPNGTGDVVVASGHKLGVGTTSPDHTLTVSASSSPVIEIEQTSGGPYKTNIVLNGNDTEFRGSSGNIEFYTGNDDGASSTERARFDSSGSSLFGGDLNTSLSNNGSGFIVSGGHHYLKVANDTSGSTNSTMYLNRISSDGDLISFRHANSTEGKISVSGSTVTYAGGHLARWSRLSDNSKPTTLLKGTVMTNLDAMLEWGDEDNEQHNHTAISSVEGDVNVAGVFVSWDVEDGYNDFYLAMTGDMVIRIASGTTVARGDLLMSAGDGTAKPQGDDIVRSKTIAKVTSTTKSHTYDDGSYLVPCVLMAC